MTVVVEKSGDAVPGDLFRSAVYRVGTRRQSDTLHVVRFESTYGPFGELRFVQPICGARSGRAVSAGPGPDIECKACAAALDRMS